MTSHHLRFVLGPYVAYRVRGHLRLQLVAHLVVWIGLVHALSQLGLPLSLPLLGANVGALATIAGCAYWLTADPLAAALVGTVTVGWANAPHVAWGQGSVAALLLSLVAVLAALLVSHFARIYHHERAQFLEPGAGLDAAHRVLFGAFHFTLLELLRRGFRPALRRALDDHEHRVLRLREQVPWANWAKLASCRAQLVSAPRTPTELAAAVRAAYARHLRVRVVASGFSWSSLCTSNDALLFCERMDQIEVETEDEEHPTVWVEAGVTNRQLNAELARHGLCMPWNVVLETVRIAGLVSTGTHGTGKDTSTVGDLVEALEVIDVSGRLSILSEATIGLETMRAVRLGLGLFGVIARIKLRVTALHRVRQTDHRLSVADMLDRIPALVAGHDSVELYWFPFNRDAWVRTIDRTQEPHTREDHGIWFRAQNFLQCVCAVLFFRHITRVLPSLTPALLRLGMRMLSFRTRVMDLPESHHYRHWIEMMPAGCMEVGFKVDDGYANVRRAWQATERLVAEYARRGAFPLNLTLNVRFTGSSGALLSPAWGAGITCYVEIMWMGRPPQWVEFTSSLCRAWLDAPGALPHWSKEFEHVTGVVSIMREHLGDRRQRFLDALDRSGLDPERALFNDVTRRVLLADLDDAAGRAG